MLWIVIDLVWGARPIQKQVVTHLGIQKSIILLQYDGRKKDSCDNARIRKDSYRPTEIDRVHSGSRRDWAG